MLVIPGAEITQNQLTGKKNSHIIALDIKQYISADQHGRRASCARSGGRTRSASPAIRITAPRGGSRSAPVTCGTTATTLADLVDVWEAANRDDLFSVTSLKHYPVRRQQRLPQAEAPVFVEDAAALRQELAGESKEALRRNVDVALTLFRNGDWCGTSAS